MKTITFFSEKGGVGKSSYSLLYASWLHFKYGVNVAVADFNDRISSYRKKELTERERLVRENPDIPMYDIEKTWPIVNATFKEIYEIRKSYPKMANAIWFENEVTAGRLKGYDVVICDFPGSLTGAEFPDLPYSKKLCLMVIPTEKEEMTLQATLKLIPLLKGIKAHYCAFISKAQVNLNNLRQGYVNFGRILRSKDVMILPDMISHSDRMATIDKPDIIRTTFNYPDFDSPVFSGSRDLGLENLFIDITRELAKTEDLKGTGTADLSFVNALTKTKDNRQFTGSSFPEYEL